MSGERPRSLDRTLQACSVQLQGAGGAELQYAGALDCLRQIVSREGVGALYRGITLTLLRGAPNAGIQFGVYEACKEMVRGRRDAGRT